MISFTKNQMLILGLLYSNQEKEYYFREIASFLNKKPGVFQRDLNKLEEKGIVKSHYRGNQRHFKIEKQYPLYNELKSIIFKTTGIQGELKNLVESFSKIKKAFLFGSFVLEKTDKLSDIDILIIGSPKIEEFSNKTRKIERKLDREINYIIYSLKEFNEKTKNKDPFLMNVLKNKIILKDE